MFLSFFFFARHSSLTFEKDAILRLEFELYNDSYVLKVNLLSRDFNTYDVLLALAIYGKSVKPDSRLFARPSHRFLPLLFCFSFSVLFEILLCLVSESKRGKKCEHDRGSETHVQSGRNSLFHFWTDYYTFVVRDPGTIFVMKNSPRR